MERTDIVEESEEGEGRELLFFPCSDNDVVRYVGTSTHVRCTCSSTSGVVSGSSLH